MKDLDDRELDDAMKQVRGTWRPWLLLVLTLGIAGYGGWQLQKKSSDAERVVSEIDARIAEKVAQISVLEQNKEELEKRIAGVDRENQSLAALRNREVEERKRLAVAAVRMANLGKKIAERKELAGSLEQDALRIAIADRMLFDAAEPTVSQKGRELLLHLGTVVTSTQGLEVSIAAHTDDSPTAWESTAARAGAVARFLADTKVGRIEAIAYGASRPIASNKSSAGRVKNRRIEITLSVAR